MAIPAAQLGWMAGILDMKGKVVVKRNQMRATPQVVLYVESGILTIVRELGRMTGTKPEPKPMSTAIWHRKGCSEHCEDAHIEVDSTHKLVSRWTATGVAAAVIIDNLEPYLRDGQELLDAREILFENAVIVGQGAGATIKALLRLEGLGWEIPDQFAGSLPIKELT